MPLSPARVISTRIRGSYYVDEDRSESTDPAKQYPEKLDALKKAWDVEARHCRWMTAPPSAMPATRATGMAAPVSCSPSNNLPTSVGAINSANPVAASATAAQAPAYTSCQDPKSSSATRIVWINMASRNGKSNDWACKCSRMALNPKVLRST